jgi:hypothetical protein
MPMSSPQITRMFGFPSGMPAPLVELERTTPPRGWPAARRPQMVDTGMSHVGFRCVVRDVAQSQT